MEISPDILHLYLYGRLDRHIDQLIDERLSVGDSQPTWMPKEVCILPSTIPGERIGVFSTCVLKQGTEMGPFQGQLISKFPDSKYRISTNAWEILNQDGTLLGYIDCGENPTQNWLASVQCARTDREQNLEVVQIGGHVYYRATKNIKRGEELLVWYGSAYSMYMGVPYSKNRTQIPETAKETKKRVLENQEDCHTIPELPVDGKWRCVLCKRGFNSRSNLRLHMRIHTLERPFVCKFCGRKFSQSSTLRNHIRLHTGEKPYKCTGCKSSYSQLAGLRAHQRSSTHKPTRAPTDKSTRDTNMSDNEITSSNRTEKDITINGLSLA